MIRYILASESCTVLRMIAAAGTLAAALVLVLACAGTAAGAMWVVDDDSGADRMRIQATEVAV